MNEQNANSFDLIQAKHLINLITAKPGMQTEVKAPPDDAPKYASLAAANIVARPRQPVQTEAVPPSGEGESAEIAPQDFDSWESCIAWCMSVTRAEAAFVVDSQGFVIASRGRIPAQGFEGSGAELICSIEQMERVAPDAGKIMCMDVDFDKRRIMGFVAAVDEATPYVIGLVAPEPLKMEVKHKITNQIIKNLDKLD